MANKSTVIIDSITFIRNKLLVASTLRMDVPRTDIASFPAKISIAITTTAGTTLADENIGLFFCNG